MTMTGSHDGFMVVLSVVIAVIASFTALDLANRMRASAGRARILWLIAASVALGGGIWSMHFVAMLALDMPHMRISYDPELTLLSLFVAIGFTGIGFVSIGRKGAPGGLVAAGVLMGLGVAVMHYIGMAGMRMDADLGYRPGWVALSFLIAIGAAIASLWLASRDQAIRMRLAAALAMGVAISGMHYTGMRAAIFSPHIHAEGAPVMAGVSEGALATVVTGVTLLILLLAWGAATIDRWISATARREARVALRLRLSDVMRETGTDEALEETAALMGKHFAVSRAGYGVLYAEENIFDYRICWNDGSVPALLGQYPASTFGKRIVAALKAGETVVVDNLTTAPISADPQAHRTAKVTDTQAILIVPFLQGGRLWSILYLNCREPRQWTIDEIRFMEEIAERTRQLIARANAERRLRELNETLEQRVLEAVSERQVLAAVVDNTSASVMVCAPDLQILALNRAQAEDFEKIYGRRCRVGDNLLDLLHDFPEHRAMIHAQWKRALAGEAFVIVDEFGDAAFDQAHYEVHFHPMRDGSGSIMGAFLTAYDVSDRVQTRRELEIAQEALRQSQKMEAMGQLTGGVAHDFNNLLTPILGALDMLRRRGVGTERDQRLIDGAFQSADKAKLLVQRLLAFARRQPLQAVPVDIGRLVTGIAELIGSTTGPQIRVSVDAAEGLPPALADPNQLEMALVNLSVNARDAMPDGGTLNISVSVEQVKKDRSGLKAGRYIRISIVDTGIGMDKATLERAIEPFFSTKGIGRGTGLGLSMVHGLASQLGGALEISSQPGVGTSIELWLPESTAPVASDGEGVAQPVKALKQGRVLLVDDEEIVRMSTAEMLDDLGYSVVEASSAEEAFDLVEKGERFDFLLTDHLMPGMTGIDLAARIRDVRPKLPVLLVSGYAELEGVTASIPRLTKPFCKDELAASMAEL